MTCEIQNKKYVSYFLPYYLKYVFNNLGPKIARKAKRNQMCCPMFSTGFTKVAKGKMIDIK